MRTNCECFIFLLSIGFCGIILGAPLMNAQYDSSGIEKIVAISGINITGGTEFVNATAINENKTVVAVPRNITYIGNEGGVSTHFVYEKVEPTNNTVELKPEKINPTVSNSTPWFTVITEKRLNFPLPVEPVANNTTTASAIASIPIGNASKSVRELGNDGHQPVIVSLSGYGNGGRVGGASANNAIQDARRSTAQSAHRNWQHLAGAVQSGAVRNINGTLNIG